MRHRAVTLLAAGLGLATGAHAHDFWIEPSSFHPAPGAAVAVRLRVGEHLRGDPVARDPRHLGQFVLVDAAGIRGVGGRAGDEPAGLTRPAEPGIAVLAYRSRRTSLELAPQAFEDYLRAEGLEAVLAARAARGGSGAPGREVFSRCAKALLAVGDGPRDRGHDRVLGYTLELVPERSPYVVRVGDELPLVLHFKDAPLPRALVVALHADETASVRGRTDARGRVRLRLARPGAWLIKAVHMVAAPPDTGADWESLWASLSFELPAAPARPRDDRGTPP